MTDPLRRRVVYVSYDGLADPLGQSQVLPYILGLAEKGHHFEVLSFEKPGAKLRYREQIAARVRWTALRYHQTPTVPATAFDMAQGLGTAATQAIFAHADLIHCRSYVSATLALPYAVATNTPLIFDTRGVWCDEKVESGVWPADGRLYRAAKKVERVLFEQADAITVLTDAFQRYLRTEYPFARTVRAPIHVIPTCVDLDHFRPSVEAHGELSAQLHTNTVLVYAGSLGGFYMDEEMARFYLAWRRHAPSARFLVLSKHKPEVIERVLAEHGAAGELIHRTASRQEMPSYLKCADAAVGFDARKFAGLGTAPTKLGEAFAMGLPMAVTDVGDVSRIVGQTSAGLVVKDFSETGLERAAKELARMAGSADVSRAARAHAEKWFSLSRGVDAYNELYQAIPLTRAWRWRLQSYAKDATWPRDTARGGSRERRMEN